MSQDTMFGGIPDELPAGYGYADSVPATVHRNVDTAHPTDVVPTAASAHYTQGRGSLGDPMAGYTNAPRGPAPRMAPPRVRVVPNASSRFRPSGIHTTPTDAISMVPRPTRQQIPSGVPQYGNGLPPGYGNPTTPDYGTTREDRQQAGQERRENRQQAGQERREARLDVKTTKASEKDSQKRHSKAWQQAAQLGLRFDRPRGKWYRDVKITGVNIPGSSEAEERDLLKQGAAGPLVREAQSLLAQRGFPSGTDGKFSEAMKKQVAGFQKSANLTVDGRIGPETWEALDPRSPKSSTGGDTLLVRQYQDDAVSIMRGPLPKGATRGAVLPTSKFPQIVAAIRDELEETYNDFPMPDLTPPPAGWDFEKGKKKSGFNFDAGAFASQLARVGSRFKPSGTESGAEAGPYTDPSGLSEGDAPSGPNWMLIGGIAVGVVVIGGVAWAFWPKGKSDTKSTPPGGA